MLTVLSYLRWTTAYTYITFYTLIYSETLEPNLPTVPYTSYTPLEPNLRADLLLVPRFQIYAFSTNQRSSCIRRWVVYKPVCIKQLLRDFRLERGCVIFEDYWCCIIWTKVYWSSLSGFVSLEKVSVKRRYVKWISRIWIELFSWVPARVIFFLIHPFSLLVLVKTLKLV